MSRTALVKVTVAAGCHVTIPHPSGIRELPPVVRNGGEVFEVTPETAADLFAARLINDPQTGSPPPPPPAAAPVRPRVTGPCISTDGGRSFQSLSGGNMVANLWSASDAAPPSSEDRAPRNVPPWDPTAGAGRITSPGSGVVVTNHGEICGADGRPWPTF